ncbi:MAG: TonB-dependent receptor [Acidobacteria bacterium]|nr:TonB-dependent receptor [Acidobacteriota bacterium]
MRNRFIAAVLFPVLFTMTNLAFAESESEEDEKPQEVVVSATKLETPTREVGSSITVITGEQIEKMQKTTVLDVLRTAPALDVNQSGGPGASTSIFIRGAKSEHTLVIIDGVEMNNPITPGRTFNFAHLSVDNIERIEILRGPQSTLYGSDAIGGVINIITKRGKEKPGGFASVEGGSYGSFRGAAASSGGNEWVQYSLGFSHWNTDGISSASEQDGNTEQDGYKNTSISGTLGFTPSDYFDLDFSLRFIDADLDIDNGGGAGQDDPNNKEESQQVFFRAQGTFYLFDDIWEQKLGFSLADQDRNSRNDFDADNPDLFVLDSYQGQILKFDWQNNFYIHDTNTLTFGIETEEDKGESDYYSESEWGPYESVFAEQTARTTGYYLQDQVRLRDSWFTTAGVRWDDHSRFGTKTTYRIASAYLIRETDTKIKGSFGTGFKSPSLFQLYSSYGDPDLEPEESTGWDFGLEQSLYENRVTLGATVFHNELDNMIDYDYATWSYGNIARADTKGIEVFGSAQAAANLDLRLNYTYTKTKDITTGEPLLRRAGNKFNFILNYGFLEKGNVNLEIVYVGERDDIYGTKMDGYVLFNPAFSCQVTENIEMFGRFENLFDRDYVEVAGYGTSGISVYGGIKVLFKGM